MMVEDGARRSGDWRRCRRGTGASRACRWQERRVGDEDPVVGETGAAAIGAIPEDDGVDGGGSAEIDLPPGVGFEVGVGDGVVEEVAVGVAIDGAGGSGAGEGGALGGGLAGGEVGGGGQGDGAEDLDFGEAEVIGGGELDADVAGPAAPAV